MMTVILQELYLRLYESTLAFHAWDLIIFVLNREDKMQEMMTWRFQCLWPMLGGRILYLIIAIAVT